MKNKIYLFNLSDLFYNPMKLLNFSEFDFKEFNFPKDNDSNFNKEVEEIETETHIIKKETWISTDGTSRYVRTWSESKKTKLDVDYLQLELKRAVEKEDFEKAAKLRDQIRKIKKEKGEI